MKATRCLLTLVAVMAIFLNACVTPATPAPATSAPQELVTPATPAPATSIPQEPVKLTMLIWSDNVANDQNMQGEIKLFNDSHPDIQVELIGAPWGEFTAKLQTMVAGGTPPDIIWIQNETDYVSKGLLLPLDDLIKQDIDASRYVAGAMAPAYDGKYYGLRHDIAYWILFYNKDMFDAAGVSYPPVTGSTIPDLMAAACKLSKPADKKWGIHNLNWVTPQIMYREKQIKALDFVNGVPQYSSSDDVINTYQMMGDFINKDNCQINKDQGDSLGGADPFIGQNVAMKLDGTWAFAYIADLLKFNWGIAAFPVQPDNMGMKVGISKASQNQAAAWTFLKWLTYEPEAIRYRAEKGMGQPAITDAQAWEAYYTGKPAELKSIVEVMSKPESVFNQVEPPGRSEADGIVNAAIDEVWFGTGAAKDVLPPAFQKGNEILAKEWAKIKP